MGIKCIIQNMKLKDINSSIDINLKCLPENYSKDIWIKIFDNYKQHCFVATVSNEVVGYILSGCIDNRYSIISIAVDSNYRNKNIGKQLIFHCLNSYFNKDVYLHCRTKNPALDLYKKIGFKELELIKDYYQNPTDDGYDMKIHVDKKYITNKKLSL